MRISDWSSDVCSSDLLVVAHAAAVGGQHVHRLGGVHRRAAAEADQTVVAARLEGFHAGLDDGRGRVRHRSEEHTSELQSLMRISYAVFCLKKKNLYCTNLRTEQTQLYYDSDEL